MHSIDCGARMRHQTAAHTNLHKYHPELDTDIATAETTIV